MSIAIIIPCYNHAHFLPGAVASVVAQTLADWEIIIVDDGSSDNTLAVAERLIARFAPRRIRLISQANQGQGASRNAGIAATSAEFILTLDADDLLASHFLERTLAVLLSQPEVGFVTTNVRFFGAETAQWSGGEPSRKRMLFDCRMVMAVLFRREAWAQANGFQTKRELQGYEDWDFWLRLIEHGWHGALVPEELVWYRRSDSSALTRAMPQDLRFRATLVTNHSKLYPPAFLPWAQATLANWPPKTAAQWAHLHGWYTLLVARYAPQELAKTVLRPAFKAIGPHQQMYARQLARVLGLSRAR